MYSIVFGEESVDEIRRLRAAERARLPDEIERQLRAEPAKRSSRRKMLVGLISPWDEVAPIWQLRVGDLRVFYEVHESGRRIIIRAVRRKSRKTTTEEIV